MQSVDPVSCFDGRYVDSKYESYLSDGLKTSKMTSNGLVTVKTHHLKSSPFVLFMELRVSLLVLNR